MGNANTREPGAILSKTEIERIKRRFERQSGKTGKISLAEFQQMPELGGNYFISRIFHQSDSDRDGFINVDEFTEGVERLGKMYSEEEKVRFAFQLYDLDEDGYISQDDLLEVLTQTTRGTVNPQQLNRTVAALIQEYDSDKDHCLSFPEFRSMAAAGGAEPRPLLG